MPEDNIPAELRNFDRELIDLLNKRYQYFDEHNIADELQPSENLSSLSPNAARELTQNHSEHIPEGLIEKIITEIRGADIRKATLQKIAFLGVESTFSHQAAIEYFGNQHQFIGAQSLDEVFDFVTRGKADFGIVPVENSSEGPVTHTLDLFGETELKICAELNLGIHHCLLANEEGEDYKCFYSHPQVFAQCRHWLLENFPNTPCVELSSTSEAAERCSKSPGTAACASALAAERFKLKIVESNIQDIPDNTTRFLVIGKDIASPTGYDKTSLLMVLRDRVGALYDSLVPFRENGINLTFIESRPSKRRKWEYQFFLDFGGHCEEEHVCKALDALQEHCQFIKILGSYPRASN